MQLNFAEPRQIDLLAFGDPVADIVVRVDVLPGAGGKVVGEWLGVHGGGTTANAACAAARLGASAAVYGRVGSDPHGALLRDSLSAFGVSLDYLATPAGIATASASAMTIVPASGDKSVIYLPMAAIPLDSVQLSIALAQTRLVYAMPYDINEFALLCRLARSQRTLVAIDLEEAVAPTAQAMQERAALADIVFFNEAGFRAGTGEAPTPAALRRVLALGPALVVVTRGAAGAIAASREKIVEQAAFPAAVVDTTGAGDTFNAALSTAMLNGAALEDAMHFACAAASCTVAAMGARGGLPTRSEVERLIAGTHP